MTFNLQLFGEKLLRYREQFQLSLNEVSTQTGIPTASLVKYESGVERPTGDVVLILADYYKCDYKFFLSNQKLASFEETETLFRRFGNEFSKQDRWAVQECLFLAECESYLERKLHRSTEKPFHFEKTGTYFKKHGINAAEDLRQFLGYSRSEVSMNVYDDMRRIGVRVFRRALEASEISGLCINHPVAGRCVLINYSEDIYRQRFTAAHEMAHTILDEEEDILVSFSWDKNNLVEVRANAFASAYLMPPVFLRKIPSVSEWTEKKAIDWANKFKVSTQALAIALLGCNLIDDSNYSTIVNAKVPKSLKEDPELPAHLPPRSHERKRSLLEHGLSNYYVALCFEAYRQDLVSAARLMEMFMIDSDHELAELADLYGESIRYAS